MSFLGEINIIFRKLFDPEEITRSEQMGTHHKPKTRHQRKKEIQLEMKKLAVSN